MSVKVGHRSYALKKDFLFVLYDHISTDVRVIQWTFELDHVYGYGEDPDITRKQAKTVKICMSNHCRIKNN